jgi:hypothetical protein
MKSYSPAALAMVDFTWRLAGVRETGDQLEWNVRPRCAASQAARFVICFDRSHTASMVYSAKGAWLQIDRKNIARIDSGATRLITDKQGRPKLLAGISENAETLSIKLGSRPVQHMTLRPNRQLQLG